MPNYDITPGTAFTQLLLYNHPGAIAWVSGSEQYPGLSGAVIFYHTTYGGVLVEAEIFGLPNSNLPGSSSFYAMHIHDSGDCSDHFSHTGLHYNPQNALHPDHAGDMPPLLGIAFMYLLIVIVFTWLQGKLERRLRESDRR